MSLEQVIAANTAAMQELTALLKGGALAPALNDTSKTAPKASKDTPKPTETSKTEPASAEVPSIEDLRKAAAAYMAEHGKDGLGAVLRKHGGAKLTEISEENRAAFLAEIA